MKRRMRRYIIATISVGLLTPSLALAATLRFSTPATAICQGKSYVLDIRVDSPSENINTVQLELTYNPSDAVIEDISTSGSIFKFWPFGPDWDNTVGYSHGIGGLITPGFKGTNGLVVRPTVHFPGSGPKTIVIKDTSDILLDDGYGTSTSVTFENLNVTVLPVSDPSCTPPTPTPTPTPTPGPTSTPGPTATPGPTGTPGPTPTPSVCPTVPLCTLASGSSPLEPCDIVESCPGQPDKYISNFVDPSQGVTCPIHTLCSTAAVTPTATPSEPGTTQQDVYQILSQVMSPTGAQQITQAVYGGRPAVGLLSLLGTVSAVAALFAAAAQLRGVLGGLSELASLLWFRLLGLTFLRRKRTRFWGTVYDSFTKRPIPLATVELLGQDNRLLERRVTDTEGRFGFLISPESLQTSQRQVQLRVTKHGYRFPSTVQVGVESEFYKNTYRGGVVAVSGERLLSFDVPLDPQVPPQVKPRKPAATALIGWLSSLSDASYRLSLVTAPVNFLLQPTSFNGFMVGVVAAIAVLRSLGLKLRPYGVIVDSSTGLAMPFAFVTLNDHEGRRMGYAVSDEHGRYFLLSQGGMHELSVSSPAQVTPARKSIQVVQTPDGWVRRKVAL